MDRFACFDTALGRCALVWGEHGITGVQLPGSDDAATRRRIRRAHPGAEESAPTPAVADAIARIARLFEGEPDDLVGIALDTAEVPEFNRRVYAVTRTVPPGETTSYGEVAARIGRAGRGAGRRPRAGAEPVPDRRPVPPRRRRGRAPDGFSAPGGIDTKRRMLEIEGATAPALF